MAAEPVIPMPPRELDEIELIDTSLSFPSFTSQTAWALGSLLRAKLFAFSKPCVVDISLAQSKHCLFHCVTHSGTTPNNDEWVARKRETVLRWGCSSWYMQNKFAGDDMAFAAKLQLGSRASEYAIHGGGWPIRVRGVEGVVAVAVVSGLRPEEDHGIIVQAVGEMLEQLREELVDEMSEKKKED